MSIKLYVMVSIPEANLKNIFTPPIILGVFDSKENAQNAWKKRTADFKDIKAKTIHTYYEMLSTEQLELPESVYLWATYKAYAFSEEDAPNLYFIPFYNGFFETYEDYQRQKEWLKQQNPIPFKEVCEKCGFIFYASNEDIIEKFEINRLVRVSVKLTDRNCNDGE